MLLTAKRRGVVVDVNDPQSMGRIRARLLTASDPQNATTPWAFPCAPLAGPGYGLFCLPRIGDEVWVERGEGGVWIWTGFSWRGTITKPADGSATMRVFRTPAGHEVSFDETGDVKIEHAGGSAVTLKQNGDVVIEAGGDVHLGGEGGKTLVTSDILSQWLTLHTHSNGNAGLPTGMPINPLIGFTTSKTKAT